MNATGDHYRSASPDPSTASALTAIPAAWNRFWWGYSGPRPVQWLRRAVSLFAAVWLLSFLPEAATWFGSDGLLPATVSANLIEFEETARWQHWSPLWWTNQAIWIRAYLVAAAGVALLAAVGVGGRLTIGVTLLLIIGWVHRIVWLQGPVEPLLVAFVGYLLIADGNSRDDSRDWRCYLTVRLFQTHWWLLFAVGWLSQLANNVWWRGDAVWWLAANGRSLMLGSDWLGSNATLINGLTHLLILVQACALWWLVVPALRWLGVAAALLSLLGIGCMADQALYALLLACGLLAFSRREV